MYVFIPTQSMIDELWLPITAYNLKPYYMISNKGRLFSTRTRKMLSPFLSRDGYFVTKLTQNDGKLIGVGVHRLVLITFSPIINSEDYEVNHKDGVKINNDISNLEWTTPSENDIHAVYHDLWNISKGEDSPNTRLNNLEVDAFCALVDSGVSVVGASKKLQIDHKASYCVFDNIYLGLAWIEISKKYNFTKRLYSQFSDTEFYYIIERIFYDTCANRTIYDDMCKTLRGGATSNKYMIRKGINGISKIRYDLEHSNLPYKPALVFID